MYRALLFVATVWGITQILFLVDSNFSRAKQFQESDYIMTFYVAGHLIAAGKENELYPAPGTRSFIGASFDKAAHTLLDGISENTTAIYMYSPLLAFFFAPLSLLNPNWSLLVWHTVSILALIASCRILAQLTRINFVESVILCSLFAPVFITLWSGQLGIVFGLLPLSLGYFLLIRDRALTAGLVWSLLALKPQYLPAAVFVGAVLGVRRNIRLALGLALGIAIVMAANVVFFTPGLVIQWLTSHKLSDTLFTNPEYGIPTHLITSLPADLLLLLPRSTRSAWKWPIYFGAFIIWSVGFWYAWKITGGPWDSRVKISLILAIGCVLCSLALPHLLYYDLCILIPAGFILAPADSVLRGVVAITMPARLSWAIISLYLPMFLLDKANVGTALVLEFLLSLFFIFVLMRINRAVGLPAIV